MGTGICPFCGKEVDKFIMFRGDVVGCRYCGIHTKQTNADHIRTMSDEELAETFAEIADCVVCETMMNADCRLHHGKSSCRDCWLDLLRKEVT